MRWLTNMNADRARGEPDPVDLQNAPTYRLAKKDLRDFLRGKVVGEPKATKECNLAHLKAQGLVGIYEPDRSIIVTPGEAPDPNRPEADQK